MDEHIMILIINPDYDFRSVQFMSVSDSSHFPIPPVSPDMAVRYALKNCATHMYYKRIPYKFALQFNRGYYPGALLRWRSFRALASDYASYKRPHFYACLPLNIVSLLNHVYRYSPIHASQRKTANNQPSA
jgi:hypothetical protein